MPNSIILILIVVPLLLSWFYARKAEASVYSILIPTFFNYLIIAGGLMAWWLLAALPHIDIPQNTDAIGLTRVGETARAWLFLFMIVTWAMCFWLSGAFCRAFYDNAGWMTAVLIVVPSFVLLDLVALAGSSIGAGQAIFLIVWMLLTVLLARLGMISLKWTVGVGYVVAVFVGFLLFLSIPVYYYGVDPAAFDAALK